MSEHEIAHDSQPYGGKAQYSSPYRPGASQPPPPPTVVRPESPPTMIRTGKPINIDIEGAIAKSVTDYVEDSKSFGTSLLRGIRHFVVPMATVLDLTSAVLRFLTLSFLLLLPETYNAIFYPPVGDGRLCAAHYIIFVISVLGIAVGVPVALFSSVFSLVTLHTRRESVFTMTSRKARNERMKYFKMKMRTAWGYIMVAFLAGAFISVPYFTSQDTNFPATLRQVLSEVSFITVPLICTIVTMLTERETTADMVEGGSQIGTGIGMYTIFEAGRRLAQGVGRHVDAAAIRNAMNGDIGGAIEAGVAELPGVSFLTLSDIAEMLGCNPAKDDPFRRTLNNIVGAAYRRGTYGIKKDPIKGYMVPDEHFAELFKKYTYNRPPTPTNVVALKKVKTTTTKSKKQEGLIVRLWHALVGGTAPGATVITQARENNEQAS